MKFHAYIFGYPPEINIKYSERILKQFRMCCLSDFDILWHFNPTFWLAINKSNLITTLHHTFCIYCLLVCLAVVTG